ncbi:MAG: ABC transporter permease [Planctomycetota bacterium]
MTNALHAAWLIARKDLQVYFRDRSALLLGFLLPIALMTVLGFVMGKSNQGGSMAKVTILVSAENTGEAAEQLLQQLRSTDMLRVVPGPNQPAVTAEQARRAVADGERSHAILIPADYGSAGGADLTLIRDPGRQMEDSIVRISLMQAVFASSGTDRWQAVLSDQLEQAGMDSSSLTVVQERMQQLQSSIDSWAQPDDEDNDEPEAPVQDDSAVSSMGAGMFSMEFLDSAIGLETEDQTPPKRSKNVTYMLAQAVCGVSVMMLMFGLASCASTLIQERDGRTLQRLIVSAVPRGSLLGGKALFIMIVGAIQMLVLFLYGEMIFGVGIFQSPLTLAVVSLVWVLCAGAYALLLAAIARTTKQADGMATIFNIVLAALGGCWFPLQILNLPWYADWLTKSTMTYWSMSAYQQLFWNGQDLSNRSIQFALMIQLGFAVVMAIAARWVFGRNYLSDRAAD